MIRVSRGASALLLASLLALPATMAAAQTVTTAYGPFAIDNLGGGQLSDPYFTVNVSTAGQLDVEYVASAGHCSNVIMHFLVDGTEQAVSGPLTPGQSTGFVVLGPVSPGTHTLGLQAEGVVGGCNAGTLGNWGGVANVRTVPLAASAPATVPGPGLVATALFFVAGAWLMLRRRLRGT